MIRIFVSIVFIFCFAINIQAQTQKVLISTDFGDMKVELFDETPKHRDNFIKLVKDSFYNDLLFHRVIEGFMIQGGDPESKNAAPHKPLGGNGPGYTIDAEIVPGFIHQKGAIAAARLSDRANPKRESSGSQFFIVQGKVLNEKEIEEFETKVKKTIIKEKITNYARSHREEIKRIRKEFSADSMRNYQIAAQRKIINEIDESEYRLNEQQRKAYTTVGGAPFLDGKYTVFGQVVEGLSVIDSIAVLETDQRDRPLSDVKIKIRIITD